MIFTNYSGGTLELYASFIKLVIEAGFSQVKLSQLNSNLRKLHTQSGKKLLQKLIKEVIQQQRKHQHWFNEYQRSKQSSLRQVFTQLPSSRYTIRCSPLAIIIILDEQDFLHCVESYGTNGITQHQNGLTFIVVHSGGYTQQKRARSDVDSTLRHELGHALFDLQYLKTNLISFKKTVPRLKNNLVSHQRFVRKMNREHSHYTRSEYFAYSTNGQFNISLDSLTGVMWKRRLKLANIILCSSATITPAQRRTIYSSYLQEYQSYLHDLYRYQCWLYWLNKHNKQDERQKYIILALIYLTPLESIRSVDLPRYQSHLKFEVQRQLKSEDIIFEKLPVALKVSRLMQTYNNRPHPRLVLPLIKKLTWTDEASWSFLMPLLREYIRVTNLAGREYITLLQYIIWHCPADDVKEYAMTLLYCLISDKKLTAVEVKKIQKYCRVLSRRLSHDNWLRQKIKNLIL